MEQTPQCIPLQDSRRSDVSQEQEGGDLITMTIKHIKDAVAEKFPAVRRCHTAEWWAQWKPHHAGHELHFDSVFDTGSETVLTPIVSTVLYLSAAVGGSTLVTDQSLDSNKVYFYFAILLALASDLHLSTPTPLPSFPSSVGNSNPRPPPSQLC